MSVQDLSGVLFFPVTPFTQTLAVVMQSFANTQAGSGLPLYGDLMAAAVVSAIPVVVLYLVFQRYLIRGLSAGSMAGI